MSEICVKCGDWEPGLAKAQEELSTTKDWADATIGVCDKEIRELRVLLSDTRRLMYGLGLDARQASLAQKIVDRMKAKKIGFHEGKTDNQK